MAAAAEDDEAWLYGEGGEKGDPAPPGTEPIPEKPIDREAGEVLSGEEGENKKPANGETEAGEGGEDDDDDSDDDIQVTIGDLKPQPYESSKFKTGYQRSTAQTSSSVTKAQPKGVDVDAAGSINGTNIYEFDLDSLQSDEKPWRKPGADITDYFNYGFTEDTWMRYCNRQRMLRSDNNVHSGLNKIHMPMRGDRGMRDNYQPNRERRESVNDHLQQQMTIETTELNGSGGPLSPNRRGAGPPPGRKMAGAIDVIGSTTNDSRRPARDFQEVPPDSSAEAQDFKKYPIITTGNPVPTLGGLPPMNNMPPPDFTTPPPGLIPNIPPPGMILAGPPPVLNTGIPPPNMAGPPPGFPPPPIPSDPYDAFYPPGHGGPPPDNRPPMGFDDRPPFGFGPPGPFGGPPPMNNPGPPPWEQGRPGDNFNRGPWNYGPGPGPGHHSDNDISSSDDERDRRGGYRPTSDRDSFRRERSRSRDRRHRDRERDRDRDRERDRDRGDRDRDRDNRGDRDREDRHSRSRRKRDDDDHHRSKHKKSKRSKRDREEGGAPEEGSSQTEEPPPS